jgi:hypothetical protein
VRVSPVRSSPSLGEEASALRRQSLSDFLTNMSQPMPWPEKLGKLSRNLWRRVVLRQSCCGHDGEPGC